MNKYNEYYNFRNFMYEVSDEFNRYEYFYNNAAQIKERQAKALKVLSKIKTIGALMFISGIILFVLHYWLFNSKIPAPDNLKWSFAGLCYDLYIPIDLTVSAILYWMIAPKIVNKDFYKDEAELSKCIDEYQKINQKIHQHYLKYKNPPLPYQFSNPFIINDVIKIMEEKNTTFEVACGIYNSR